MAGKKKSTGAVEENKTPFQLQASLTVLLRIVMGGVFIYASYDKILHTEAFAKAVYNYQILPDNLINIVAICLPWLELLLGFCLITGVWLPGATVISTSMLMIFMAALGYNLSRGLNVHCGCFSTDATEGPAGVGTILRDVAFLCCSIYIMVRTIFFHTSSDPDHDHDQDLDHDIESDTKAAKS